MLQKEMNPIQNFANQAPPQVQFIPSKKPAGWKLLAIVVFLFLAVGSCTALFTLSVKAPVDAANDFLAAAASKDLSELQRLVSTSTECFGSDAKARLEQFVSDVPVSEYNLNNSFVETKNGKTTARVSGEFRGYDGIQILMTKQEGQWLVCGLRLGTAA